MTIKCRLVGLVALTSLLLCLLAAYLVWASAHIRHDARLLTLSIDYLQGIADSRSSITRQSKEAMDFLTTASPAEKEEFEAFGRKALAGLELWKRTAEKQRELDVLGEEEDLLLQARVQETYLAWVPLFDSAFEGLDHELTRQTGHPYPRSAQDLLDAELLPATDSALSDAQGEVEKAFHHLLNSLGMIPWIAEEASGLLEGTHASIDHFTAGNRLKGGLHLQITALKSMILSGKDADLKEFYRLKGMNDLTLNRLIQADQHRGTVGAQPAAARPDETAAIRSRYRQLQRLSERIIRMHLAGQSAQALKLTSGELEELTDRKFFPQLSRAVHGNTRTIAELTDKAGKQGGIAVVGVCLAIILVAYQLIRRILSSLDRVRSGIEIIGGGNVQHRIGMGSSDELGKLADAFDVMAGRLQETMQDLSTLNVELEQRVEERTAELEQANQALEAFNYTVSHDLRIPLTQISGFAQLLLDKLPADDEQAQMLVERVLEGSGRMELLIKNLLSHAGVNRAPLNPEPVDLSSLVERLACELRERDPQRPATFEIAPDLSAASDSDLLCVALTNLLENAWKYSSKEEQTSLQFGRLESGEEEAFFLRDNGCGFDMAHADRLFLPFQRLHLSSDYAGSGIGLATVQAIVHRHGGRIWAEAAPGQGATFYFTLDLPPNEPSFSALSA